MELKRPQGIKFVNFNSQGQVVADGCQAPNLTLLPAREDYIQHIAPCMGTPMPSYAPVPYNPNDEANAYPHATTAPSTSGSSADQNQELRVINRYQNNSTQTPAQSPAKAPVRQTTKPNNSNADEFERALLGL